MSYLRFLWDRVKYDLVFYLFLLGLIIAFNAFIGLTFIKLVLILLTASFLKSLHNKSFNAFLFFKNAFVITLVVAAFWFLPRLIGWWFVWVLLGAFLIYKVWRGRELFMRSMRFVEEKLFGRSLDKDNFKEGEKPSIYKEEKNEK